MNLTATDQYRLFKIGLAAGLAATIMYPSRAFLPLPSWLLTPFWIFFGPTLILAFVGLYPFITRGADRLLALFYAISGIITGAFHMSFTVVQSTNLSYIRPHIRNAVDEGSKEIWSNVLSGVFTVQNGLNYVTDFFLDSTVLLAGVMMWRHPRFGPVFTVLAFASGGLHMALKYITFPKPPASAGLFDAGPAVGIFWAVVTVKMITDMKWFKNELELN